MKIFWSAGFWVLAFAASICGIGADTHIYAGALGTNQNEKLFFSNGILFDSAATNYSLPQILRTNGFNAGHYRGDVLTFSALAGTVSNGGPIPGHAAFGSKLAVEVVSVQGPAGGSFAFWEGDGENVMGSITFSVPAGTMNSTNYFVISENSGEEGDDPYGHIHGRVFTCSASGTYTVGFRVIDISTNGVGGEAIHFPSDVMHVRFQAGLRIEAIRALTNRVTVSFRSPPGISNLLETSESVGSATWQGVPPPLRGNNSVQTVSDTNPPAANRFYRLRQLNNLP
jgi:hypothetical protein